MLEWQTIVNAWPLLVGGAIVWARLEVSLYQARTSSEHNEKEIAKLDRRVELQASVAQHQAVQLGRIEESILALSRMLERIDRKLGGD